MTKQCTCPTGDGSLRWPCPIHPPEGDTAAMANRVPRIWSRRFSVAHGWRWVPERIVSNETASEWINVFQSDEPNVTFRIADTQPKD